MQPLLIHSKAIPYYQRVKALFGSSLVAYYPRIHDGVDISGNNHTGAPTAVSAGLGIGDGLSSGVFDGVTSYVNLPASLRAAFPYTEGSFLIWPCVDSYDVWIDNTSRRMFEFIDGDGSDYMRIYKDPLYNRYDAYYRFGDVATRNVSESSSSSGFSPLIFTWSKSNNRTRLFTHGRLRGTSTYPDDVLHVFFRSNIGTSHAPVTNGWLGRLAHFAIGNIELNPAQALVLSPGSVKLFTILGDSVSTLSGHWASRTVFNYPTRADLLNHAYSGHSIMANMDAQVVAAAGDNAGIIIIELGTNDNNAGNMANLQAEAEENIAELKVSNPRAALYWLNVLPRWTDNGGGTPVDKGNIRTAIAAACTAKGITCWDTFTAPWITAAQTIDGLHPTAAGHAAIAVQALARL